MSVSPPPEESQSMQEVEGVEDKSLEGRYIHNQHCARRVVVVLTLGLLTITDVVKSVARVVG